MIGIFRRRCCCGSPSCNPNTTCAAVLTIPKTWRLSVPEGGQGCDGLAGDFLLGTAAPLVHDYIDPPPGTTGEKWSGWLTVFPGDCGRVSVSGADGGDYPTSIDGNGDSIGGTVTGWPVLAANGDTQSPATSINGGSYSPAWSLTFSTDGTTATATLTRRDAAYGSSEASYTATGLPLDLTTVTSIDLEWQGGASDTRCGLSTTLTVAPIDGPAARMYARCFDDCSPTLDSEKGVLHFDYTLDGVAGRVCLVRQFNEETGGYEFAGITEPITCAADALNFRLYCAYPPEGEESAGSAWAFDVTGPAGTDTLTVTVIDGPTAQFSVFGELATVCPGVNLSGSSTDCTAPPFSACCPDFEALLCCPLECIGAEGQLTGGDGVCSTTTTTALGYTTITAPGSPTGFTPGDVYYGGDFPFDDGVGTYAGWKIMIYCDGTSMRYAIIDGSGNVEQQGPLANWNCQGFTADPIDVTSLIVNTSCYSEFPGAEAFVALTTCPTGGAAPLALFSATRSPTLTSRAASFTKATGRAAAAACTGKRVIVSPETLAERKAACVACPKEERDPLIGVAWCGACGCALAAKQRLATESCPLGRWPG